MAGATVIYSLSKTLEHKTLLLTLVLMVHTRDTCFFSGSGQDSVSPGGNLCFHVYTQNKLKRPPYWALFQSIGLAVLGREGMTGEEWWTSQETRSLQCPPLPSRPPAAKIHSLWLEQTSSLIPLAFEGQLTSFPENSGSSDASSGEEELTPQTKSIDFSLYLGKQGLESD